MSPYRQLVYRPQVLFASSKFFFTNTRIDNLLIRSPCYTIAESWKEKEEGSPGTHNFSTSDSKRTVLRPKQQRPNTMQPTTRTVQRWQSMTRPMLKRRDWSHCLKVNAHMSPLARPCNKGVLGDDLMTMERIFGRGKISITALCLAFASSGLVQSTKGQIRK